MASKHADLFGTSTVRASVLACTRICGSLLRSSPHNYFCFHLEICFIGRKRERVRYLGHAPSQVWNVICRITICSYQCIVHTLLGNCNAQWLYMIFVPFFIMSSSAHPHYTQIFILGTGSRMVRTASVRCLRQVFSKTTRKQISTFFFITFRLTVRSQLCILSVLCVDYCNASPFAKAISS